MSKNKNIYLWTGNGWGKTTSALGVALREVGHKNKVIIIQFLKGRKNTGEYKIASKLKPYYKIYQFGTKEFINLKKPTKKDFELAKKGFDFIKEVIKLNPNLLILDEINLAIRFKLLKLKNVVRLLEKIPKNITVYLTGRAAPRKLIKFADYVTEVKAIKHPPLRKRAKIGIDYQDETNLKREDN